MSTRHVGEHTNIQVPENIICEEVKGLGITVSGDGILDSDAA